MVRLRGVKEVDEIKYIWNIIHWQLAVGCGGGVYQAWSFAGYYDPLAISNMNTLH